MKVDPTINSQILPSNSTSAAPAGEPTASFDSLMGDLGVDTITAEQAEEISSLRGSFMEWRGDLDTTHPLNLPRYEAVVSETEPFLQIVGKAVIEGAHSDPVAFLKNLSQGELETLRVMHSLADPIEPEGLSREGALNLLLPINKRQDIDNDGFTETGKAVGWSFPPPNAPQSVHDAWATATEGMSMQDRLMAEAMFMPLMVKVDESGNVSELARSEANNPYAKTDFSFSRFVEERLDSLDAFKLQMDPEQYELQKGALSKFLEELNTAGNAELT